MIFDEPDKKNVRFYPKDFSPLSYSGASATSAQVPYWIITPEGSYLDIDRIGNDLDKLYSRKCYNCDHHCSYCGKCRKPGCDCGAEQCTCAAGNAQGNLASGSQLSADPSGLGNIAIGLGNIFNAFKKGEGAQEVKQKLKMMKDQCPKKPILTITKKQKEKRAAYEQCMQMIADKEREIQLEAARQGKQFTPERTAAPVKNKSLWIAIGISAFILVLLIVIIIIALRKKKKAA